MHCAFLTMDHTEGWSIDAGLCIPYLETNGWEVEWIPWRSPGINWNRFDLVYLAAPWDYPDDPVEFLRVLERIEASSATLVNNFELVRWNLEKTYLRDLQNRGAAIVPSLWFEKFKKEDLPGYFKTLACEKIIIKPVISTNASNTFLLDKPVDAESIIALQTVFSDRPFMVQPFIENICSEGEFSLFYIDGVLSHAIRKVPKTGDFRVQEEHGGNIIAAEPEDRLQITADALMQLVTPAPLYARVDFVRAQDGGFLLMELELIEPSMYLRMHDKAPQRFARALSHCKMG